jgi:hypothetical protein
VHQVGNQSRLFVCIKIDIKLDSASTIVSMGTVIKTKREAWSLTKNEEGDYGISVYDTV